MVSPHIDSFLNECSKSGDSAYDALKLILQKLQNPSSRSDARIFLANVQRRFEYDETSFDCSTKYHFRIHDIILTDFEGTHNRKKLTVMEIPSIFTPEDWSFTFYEGINRQPSSMFKDKIISELGCGNGWISISIADKWSPEKVYGLDINPRAVKIAWINLYLNALDDNGNPIFDEEGKTLLDRVEFYESDLLGYCGENNIQLDQIVACIPQILNPNPEAMSKLVTENASEEFLYDLSNYCALQGFVEDQFGLGLIARAVEEGISVLKPTGTMVFNMGGRPGQAVCKRLFERRGFHIKKLWQTKILQAADTDISALVDIENNSRHRFEFFMGLVSNQPICARTASVYIGTGGQISHSLSVFSCSLHQPNQVKTIFNFLKNGFKDVSCSLDLSFEDDSVADEKIPFLAYLAGVLKDNLSFPCEPPAGSLNFRKLTARFLKSYHHIPLHAENVTVFPSRSVATENVLRLFSPRLAIVDEHLTRQLPKHWLTSLTIENVANDENTADALMVIEAPCQSDLMIELIKKLKPQVVITGMAQYEAITSSAFENLLHATGEIGSRLFLDISDHLELSSLPKSNGVLKYLSGNVLPSHAAIICGLIKNKVYSDLEVAFVISEDEYICSALSKTVELLEGHTALFSQYYYGCLFDELLAFQMSGRRPPPQRETVGKGFKDTRPSSSSMSVLNKAELSINDPKNPAMIHMDVDQNFLPIPSSVKASIFESFARQNIIETETNIQPELHQLLKTSYGFVTNNSSEFIYGNNPLALFNRLVLCCIQEGGTLLFPSGTNGHYISAAKFMNSKTAFIPTESETGFKILPKTLETVISKVSKVPWVYISGPTSNPTGSLYSSEEIKEVLAICACYGARVIIDTSFSGLEFNLENWGGWDLQCDLLKLSVSLIGGLSFEMLGGGLGFGYLVLNDPILIELFQSYPSLSKPHSTVKYAVKKLLGLRMRKDQTFLTEFAERKEVLKNQAERLSKTLKSCGWDVLDCCGGGSMVAKPSFYIGKTMNIERFEGEISSSNIREALVKGTNLCVNSESWTGIPDYCRLTFALEPVEFEKALKCIELFQKMVIQ